MSHDCTLQVHVSDLHKYLPRCPVFFSKYIKPHFHCCVCLYVRLILPSAFVLLRGNASASEHPKPDSASLQTQPCAHTCTHTHAMADRGTHTKSRHATPRLEAASERLMQKKPGQSGSRTRDERNNGGKRLRTGA